jgi:hypothetical protein
LARFRARVAQLGFTFSRRPFTVMAQWTYLVRGLNRERSPN